MGIRLRKAAAPRAKLETQLADVAPRQNVEQKIRDRAYELFLARGEQPGDPVADWLRAEREVSA